jgi:hypothetical protein
MSSKSFFIILLTIFLLSGCAPKYNFTYEFTKRISEQTPQDKGYIVFGDFDVPQPVNRIFTSINHSVSGKNVSIYDITNDLTYIATQYVSAPVLSRSNNFSEIYLPVGKRTLMLIENPPFGEMGVGKADFIEVIVSKDYINHITISEYPDQRDYIGKNWYTRPKFTKIVGMDTKSFDYCSQNICLECSAASNKNSDVNITSFLQKGSIDAQQKYLKEYCLMLSNKYKTITTLNQKSYEAFEQAKTKIEAIKNRDFPEWQKSNDKNRIFRLIQFTQPTTYYPSQKVIDGNKSYQLF